MERKISLTLVGATWVVSRSGDRWRIIVPRNHCDYEGAPTLASIVVVEVALALAAVLWFAALIAATNLKLSLREGVALVAIASAALVPGIAAVLIVQHQISFWGCG